MYYKVVILFNNDIGPKKHKILQQFTRLWMSTMYLMEIGGSCCEVGERKWIWHSLKRKFNVEVNWIDHIGPGDSWTNLQFKNIHQILDSSGDSIYLFLLKWYPHSYNLGLLHWLRKNPDSLKLSKCNEV